MAKKTIGEAGSLPERILEASGEVPEPPGSVMGPESTAMYGFGAEISENPPPSNVGLGESTAMYGFGAEISENPPPSNVG